MMSFLLESAVHIANGLLSAAVKQVRGWVARWVRWVQRFNPGVD